MNKAINIERHILYALLAICTLATYSFSQPEIEPEWQPELGVYVLPADVATFTYAENWWEGIYPQDSSLISEPSAPYSAYENVDFRLNSRVTSDYNPYASTLCEWNQNMQLLDMSIGELVQWSGQSAQGLTTTYWRDFGHEAQISVYTTNLTISAHPCGYPQPEFPVEPIVINEVGGWIGISFIAMQIVMPPNLNAAGYLYEKVTGCNVFCNLPQTNRYGGVPSACIQLQIPFVWENCSPIVRVVKNVQACVCYDISWN